MLERAQSETRTGLVEDIHIKLRVIILDMEEVRDSGKGSRELSLALARAQEAEDWLKRHERVGVKSR